MITTILIGLAIVFCAWLIVQFLGMMQAPAFLATATWIVAAALVVVKVILPLLGVAVPL
jgi:hypothetical protein